MKAGWFINLALGQQCAWSVPGDFSVPECGSTIHRWEGGEKCDASNELPETKPYKSKLVSHYEVEVQRIRLERKLFNVVLSRCPAGGWW